MWRKNTYLLLLAVFVSAVFSFSLLTGTVSATTGVNPDISFEGKIVNSSGVNITNATYNVEFTMYTGCTNEPTNNTGCTLAWTEDYLTSASEGIAMSGGTFEANLGQYCTFAGSTCQGNTNTGINWNTYPIYMSMQIGGTANCSSSPAGGLFTANCAGDGVMQPYILMTSTPYAQNAGTLGNIASSGFAQLAIGSQTFTGSNTFEDSTNSATAFQVDNNTAQVLLNVNTSATPSVNVGVTGAVALADTVNIGTSSGAIQTTDIGSTDSTSTLTLSGGVNSTTGTIALQDAASGYIVIGSTSVANNINIGATGSAANADTLNLNNSTGAIEITSIGSTDSSSATTLQGGSGNLALTTGTATGDITLTTNNASSDIIAESLTNNTNAFEVQNSSSVNVLNVDTTNGRVGVDVNYTLMSPVGTVTPSTSTTGGTLGAATYYYEVTALDAAGGQSSPSTQVSQTTTGTTSDVTLSWTAITGAAGYDVYRSTSSGVYTTDFVYGTVGTGSSSTITFIDTGSTPGVTNTAPPTNDPAYAYAASSGFYGGLQVSVGGNGTPTGQLYVSGAIPTIATGSIATGTLPFGVYVQGNYAYVVNQTSATLQIIDISNPSSPVTIGSIATGGTPNSVFVAGRYAYVTTGANLLVFDVSNPANPQLVGSVAVAGTVGFISGDYAYLYTSSTLQVFDISDPTSPVAIGSVSTLPGNAGLYVSGSYVYLLNSVGNELLIYNVSNLANPELASSISSGQSPTGVYVQGSYVYVTSLTSRILQIFNISNPNSPYLTGSLTFGVAATPTTVYVQGRYAYITANNGLQVVDVSNPDHPVSISYVGTASELTSGFISGRYAYDLSSSSNLLQIFDLGGEYAQQLQAGGAEVGTLVVDSSATVSGSEAINGGLVVGNSLQVAGNAGIGGINITDGLATPATPTETITCSGTCASSYSYAVAATNPSGTSTISTAASTTVANASLNTTTEYNETSWSAVTGASSYNVYRTAGGASQGLIGAVNYTSVLTPSSGSETGTVLTLNFSTPPPWAVGQGITLAGFTMNTGTVTGTWPITAVTATSITVNHPLGVTSTVTVPGTATGALAFYDTAQGAGAAVPTGATAGTITLQTTSTIALQVMNGSATNVLDVDTVNNVVGIGTSGVAAALLSVGGTTGNFQVNSSGTVTIAAGESYTGLGAVTLSSAAATALTITGNAASTWSTSAGAITITSGSGNIILNADSSGAGNVDIGIGNGGGGSTTPDLLVLDDKSSAGDPAGVNGAMYYNVSSNTFRCDVSGSWENCIGGLISASSPGTAQATCTVACGAIATGTSLFPANYCVAGRVIHIIANGTYSSTNATPTLALSLYLGTNAAKASDTLLGAAATAAGVGAAAAQTNDGWSLDAYIYCVSATSVWVQGGTTIESTTAGVTARSQISATAATTITNTTQNLYIFPAWGTSSGTNTITADEFIVQGM